MGDVTVSDPYYTIGGQRIAANAATAEQRYLGATQDKAYLQGVASNEAKLLQQHYNDLIAKNYDPNAVNMVDLRSQIEGAKQRATMQQYRSEYERRATGQGASVPTTAEERRIFAKQYVHINPARFPGQGIAPTEASLYKGQTKFYSRDMLKNYLTRGKAYEADAAAFMPKAEYAAKEGQEIQNQIDALNRDISTVETQADYDKVVAASQALDQRIGNYNNFLVNSDVAGSAAYLQSEFKQLETERKNLEQRQDIIASKSITTSPSPGLVVAPVVQTTYNATTGEYGTYRDMGRLVSYNPITEFMATGGIKGWQNPGAFIGEKVTALGAFASYPLAMAIDVEKWGIDTSKAQNTLATTTFAPVGKTFAPTLLQRYAGIGQAAIDVAQSVADTSKWTGYAQGFQQTIVGAGGLTTLAIKSFTTKQAPAFTAIQNIMPKGGTQEPLALTLTKTETMQGYISQTHFIAPPSVTAFQEPGAFTPSIGVTTTPQARALNATFAAKTLGGIMETATTKHWGQVGSEFVEGYTNVGANLVTYALTNPFKFAVGAAATAAYPYGAYALLGAQTAYNAKTRGVSYAAGGLAFYWSLSKGAREAGKAYHNVDVWLKGYARKEYSIHGYVTQDVIDYYNSLFWNKRGTQLPMSRDATELMTQFKAGEMILPEKVEAGAPLSPKVSENPLTPAYWQKYYSTLHATSSVFPSETVLGQGIRAAQGFHVTAEGMLNVHFLRTQEGIAPSLSYPTGEILPPSPFVVNLFIKGIYRPGITSTLEFNAVMAKLAGKSVGVVTPKAEAGTWVENELAVPLNAASEIFRGDYFKLGGIRFEIPQNFPVIGGRTVSLFQWSVPVIGYKVVETGTTGAISAPKLTSMATQGLEGIAYTKYYNPTPMREYVVPAYKSATYEAYKLPSYTPYKPTSYTAYKPASYAAYKAPSYTPYAIPSYTPYTKPRYTPYTTPSYTPYAAPSYTPYTPPRYTPYKPPSYTPYRAPRYPAYTPPEYPRYSPGATYEAGGEGEIRKAFDVLVRKKGKWLVIGKNLPRGRAYRLGILETERTPARSFKLEAKGTTLTSDVSIPPQILHYRPAKREAGVLIERSKYAINTQGEYAGITAKGIVAAKRVRPFKGRGFKL